jgi:hypothetical protein
MPKGVCQKAYAKRRRRCAAPPPLPAGNHMTQQQPLQPRPEVSEPLPGRWRCWSRAVSCNGRQDAQAGRAAQIGCGCCICVGQTASRAHSGHGGIAHASSRPPTPPTCARSRVSMARSSASTRCSRVPCTPQHSRAGEEPA